MEESKVIIIYKTYSEAQKRANKKYAENNREKLYNNMKKYYNKKKLLSKLIKICIHFKFKKEKAKNMTL